MTEGKKPAGRTPLRRSVPFWVALVTALALCLVLGVIGCGFTEDEQDDSSQDAASQEASEDSTTEGVSLAYAFQPGQTWVSELIYEFEGETPQQVDDEDEPETVSYAGKERTTAVVETVDEDGSVTLAVTVETLEDTEGGEPQDLDDPLEFKITVDPTGKVLAVEGFEDRAAEAAEDADALRDYVNDYREAFGVCTLEYPTSGTANIGDEWVVETVIPVPGMDRAVVRKTTYTLTEIRTEDGRQVAVITFSGRDTLDLVMDESEDWQDMMREWDVDQEFQDIIDEVVYESYVFGVERSTGEYLVDLATGIPLSASSTWERDTEYSAKGTPMGLFPPEMTPTLESSSSGSSTRHTVE